MSDIGTRIEQIKECLDKGALVVGYVDAKAMLELIEQLAAFGAELYGFMTTELDPHPEWPSHYVVSEAAKAGAVFIETQTIWEPQ